MSDALEDRDGLPEALRALLDEVPRAGWEAHPEFGALTRFWLERHLGFRRLLAALRAEARAEAVDMTRLSRLGGAFLGGLEEHHTVEDRIYFPKMTRLVPSLERGFAILDADHHRLHEELEAFAGDANAVLRGGGADAAGRLGDGLDADGAVPGPAPDRRGGPGGAGDPARRGGAAGLGRPGAGAEAISLCRGRRGA